MQIKASGVGPVNDPQKTEKAAMLQKQAVRGESFLNMLRAGADKAVSPAPQATRPGEAAPAEPIDAVAARSRVQYDLGADVSDFLELFREKQFLLTGVKLAEQPALNEASAGDKTLSGEQAARLREKYNVDNLPPGAQYALFRDLTELGVLSGADVRKTRLTVSPGEGDLMGYLAGEPAFRDVAAVPETDPKGRLGTMIHNERFTCQHVKQRYGQYCGAVAELADSHQRVLDAVNQL